MRIAAFLLLLATVGMVSAGPIDCKPMLTQYFDACHAGKCVMMAGGGLSADGVHANFKGNLKVQDGSMRPIDKVNILSSSSYECNANNRYQPFLADKVESISNFNIYPNASIKIDDAMLSLICVEEHGNQFSFKISNLIFSFVMSIRDNCGQINFGENCQTTTPTPTTTSSTTGTPSTVTFELKVTNSWVTGADTFTQYDVIIKNNGAQTINSLVISHENFVPTDKWNIESLPSGDLTLPSYGSIGSGQTFTFGFITKSSTQPKFTVKSSA
ncbi:extracellular matrix protein [Heterostelium album PN500]|uniref:Extracellular matrix protein n=1 Tax=Heterostelium pallidum (strain ATCC 26659 / Pp 5 / PN500) TaxID=670386 RepID=D3B805_HETP5|nr:extracellular matrix protein [Heterostelium album PN500]EFA82173.1 extracellular matrix protein [Heterostelium album PN500]|eukprot:XP_020434290.1 extracellular matrix protein [Heterostelium album PN500]